MKFNRDNSDINEYGLLEDKYQQSPENNKIKRQRYGAFTLIVVAFILIFTLFILFANIETKKKVENYTLLTYTEMYSEDDIPPTSIGYALSMAHSGKSIVGGGTSIYKDIAILTPSCPKYLNSDAMFSSHYLMSYYDESQTSSTVLLMELTNPRDTSVLTSSQLQSEVYDIATLNTETGLFVAINQDMDETKDTATVIAGRVQSPTSTFTYGLPVVYGGQYSVTPAITRLSDNTFAISYFDTNADGVTILVTRYGVVNTDDLSITFSDEVFVGYDLGFGIHQTLVGLNPSLYLIGYYNGTGTPIQTGPLSVVTVTIQGGTPVLGATSTMESQSAAFNLASDRVDNTSAIITFADVTTNFGITSVLVSVDSVTGTAKFGSSVMFSSGRTLSIVQTYLIMDLDVVVISRPSVSGNNPSFIKFLVLYSDISNGGTLTTSIGAITRSAELTQISPDFLLNSGNPNPDVLYTWATATVAGDDSNPDDIQVVFAQTMTVATCTLPATLSVSSLQMKPSPYGIAITANSGPNTRSDVLIAGTFTVSGGDYLVPGAAYFTNSFGEIVGGDVMYGSDYTLWSKNNYYYDGKTETLIDSSNSLIGIAINSNTISLRLN